jgi:hypothetical protein
MLWGCILTEKKPYELPKDSEWNLLNITNAALSRSSGEGKTYLLLTNDKEILTLAVLQKGKIENYSMSIKVIVSPKVKLSVLGNGEVHVTGYFEPSLKDYSESDIEDKGLKAVEEFEESEESSEEEPAIQKPTKDVLPKKIEKKLETKKLEEKKTVEQKKPDTKKPEGEKKQDTKKAEIKKPDTIKKPDIMKKHEERKQDVKKQEVKKHDQKKIEGKKQDQKKQEQKNQEQQKAKPKVFDPLDSESDDEDAGDYAERILGSNDDSDELEIPSKQQVKEVVGKKRQPEKQLSQSKKKHKKHK